MALAPFTPAVIDQHVCLARTWNGGTGGQCTKSRVEGMTFCRVHMTGEKWKVHGRCDGPIPDTKLREFERAAKNPRLDAAPKVGTKRSADGSAKAGKDKGPAPKAPAPKAPKAPASSVPRPKAPPALKCTCGKLIHSERCKLFRVAAAHTAAPRPRPGAPAPPSSRLDSAFAGHAKPSAFAGHAKPLAPKTYKVPAGLTAWARRQAEAVSAEVAAMPRDQQGIEWKRKMRNFHPDKRNAPDMIAVLAGKSEADVSEVFVELKRRYDHFLKQGSSGKIR